tara:strand:+ start:6957 stop:7721 length:765 start_codon:yes stop_codon:yes gene_type:complete
VGGAAVLDDSDLERYSRQLLVPEVDIAGQEALAAATVLVVGLGGLGCPAALYLAAAGVGTLRLADGDRVELSNLQRQVAHTEAGLGDNKAESAARAVRALNQRVEVEVLARHLDADSMGAAIRGADLVLDASDRFATRHALNRGCVAAGVPLLSAAAIRMEGQLALFDTARGGPCYRCLYPDAAADDSNAACAENGVLGPVVGVLGSLQALEAIKFLVGMEQSLRGAVLMLDLRSLSLQRLVLERRSGCPDCRR